MSLRRKIRGSRERGVALLMVLLMLTMLGSVVAEFQFNSQVDLQLAINARDELQAEYNALSALRVRALVLRNSRVLRTAMGQLGSTLGLGQDLMPSMTRMLDMIPVECGILSAITRISEGEGSIFDEPPEDGDDDSVADDFFPGECIATSTSEGGKISLHALRTNKRQQVYTMFVNLLSSPEFEHHFQEDDRLGQHADSPEDLAGAIADWIDDDDDQMANNVQDEDRPYAYLKDDYRPKNAPFDSLAELQLVHGIDDELYKTLKNHLTIYTNSTKLDLETADAGTVWLGMLLAGATPEAAFTLAAMVHVFQEINPGVPISQSVLIELGTSLGIDANLLRQVFVDRNNDTTWYTIEAQGRVGNASRRIHAVYQAQEGRFVYMRIE